MARTVCSAKAECAASTRTFGLALPVARTSAPARPEARRPQPETEAETPRAACPKGAAGGCPRDAQGCPQAPPSPIPSHDSTPQARFQLRIPSCSSFAAPTGTRSSAAVEEHRSVSPTKTQVSTPRCRPWSRSLELPSPEKVSASVAGQQAPPSTSDWPKEGRGVCAFPSGDKYEGDFMCGMMHGSGAYTWADGSCFQGQWVGDQRQGEGVVALRCGYRYEGGFLGGLEAGRGTAVCADGTRLSGEFAMGHMHGEGTRTFPDGDVYRGQFVMGRAQGHGAIERSDGYSYEGAWLGDLEHGPGVCKYPNGDMYEGDFAKGLRHGLGTYTARDGTRSHGPWSCDRSVGEASDAASPQTRPTSEAGPAGLPNFGKAS